MKLNSHKTFSNGGSSPKMPAMTILAGVRRQLTPLLRIGRWLMLFLVQTMVPAAEGNHTAVSTGSLYNISTQGSLASMPGGSLAFDRARKDSEPFSAANGSHTLAIQKVPSRVAVVAAVSVGLLALVVFCLMRTIPRWLFGEKLRVRARLTRCVAISNKMNVLFFYGRRFDIAIEYTYQIEGVTFHDEAHITQRLRDPYQTSRGVVKTLLKRPRFYVCYRSHNPGRTWLQKPLLVSTANSQKPSLAGSPMSSYHRANESVPAAGG